MAILSNSEKGMNAKQLAEITHFSVNHLAKVLSILKRNQFLNSLRGPNGGFTLAKDPADINLYDIYKLIEGDLKSFQCSITCEKCYFETCLFGKQPHEFNDNFKVYLETHNLGDVKVINID